jgi:hypothetical protein
MGLLDGLNPISLITDGIKAIGSIIDNVSTTDEEKLEIQNKIQVIQNDMTSVILDYQAKVTQYQSEVIIAEAKGESWLQRNWRPSLMAIFGIIVANNYIIAPYLTAMFDWQVVLEIPEQLWGLLKLGVGGYIGGRSIEKGIKLWKGSAQ